MNNKRISLGLLILTIATLGAWYRAHSSLQELRGQYLDSELQPIVRILSDNQLLMKELQVDSNIENGTSILQNYIVKIRKDGVPKTAEMKQRLDQLAENNAAIVTLIKAYAPFAKTPAFLSEGDKFRNYASAWRDRWNSIMELYMAGGNFAVVEVPFPTGFPVAVRAELAVAK